jgi:dipeptidyl aminopeptidase/acylaminoacyl peptidase
MKTVLSILVAFILAANSTLAAQNNDIAPGDNLIVEGVPKIPSSLVASASRYTNFRYAGLASWHPTKREMLISTEFGETPQIHSLKFPGGARTQLTFFSDYISGGIYQPKKGECFIFSKDTNGDEFNQIYRYDIAKGNTTLLTDGKSRNESPVWSNSGERLMYGSTRRNGTDMDLYVVNPSDPKSDRMLAQLEGGFWIPYDWSLDQEEKPITACAQRATHIGTALRAR